MYWCAGTIRYVICLFFCCQAEDGIRDLVRSRGLGDVYKRQSEGYASYTVTGRVKNVGPEEAVQVQVVLTAYDSLGRVVATRKIEPDYNVVPRGGETTFTALLAPAGGPVERVVAVAQGRRISAALP